MDDVEILQDPGESFDRRYDSVTNEGTCIIIHNFKDPGYSPEELAEAIRMAMDNIENMR